MQSRIPLPTDNIYKFYALFGLLLLVSSMALFVAQYSSFQTRAYDRFIELSALTSLEDLTAEEKAKKELFDAQVVIDKSDRKFYKEVVGVLIAISLLLILYGFRKWHKVIQPKQDRLVDLEIEKAELEIKALNKRQNQMDGSVEPPI